ncbi:putative sporulation protein YtxC [Shouchella shacheensis]|uniref:putative sporulation protein YtxC n=1 Tax=Shouchella shacheensis TaxID=1649580 RepID=UPI001FE1067C|nr:putative sporulation protein YtxC [Shouchella shacheensis]
MKVLICKGESRLIAIHFEERKDCVNLFEQLAMYMNEFAVYGFGGKVQKNGEEMILLNYENEDVDFYESFHPFVASVLADYVMHTKEDEWLQDIVGSLFHVTDEEEKKQIVEIAHSILAGERNDIPSMKPHLDRKSFLYEAFANHLDPETSFYYEPFLAFRLQDYGEILIDCVELALDEYLMEQDFQNMIESYRQYIRKTPAGMPLLHIVHEEMFTFYDQHHRKLTPEEILFYLKQELVFEEDAALDEMVISPLVSMAPGHVYVYSDDPDHGVVLSIQAIFQERLTISPLRDGKRPT